MTLLKILEEKQGKGHRIGIYRCDYNGCNNFTRVRISCIESGQVSCGCYIRESTKNRQTKHGMTGSSEYKAWQSMKDRCYNPNNRFYHRYGGRGITVCDRWMDPENGFENFLEDMGRKPFSKAQLDRIDNDGIYEPDNCRWTTQKINARNKSNNHLITVCGVTATISEFSEKHGLNWSLIGRRASTGCDHTESVLKKPKEKNKVLYNNEEVTLSELSREFDIPIQTIWRRFKDGWPIEEIIKGRKLKIPYLGMEKTITEWSKEYGLNPSLVDKRLKRGWSIEDSLIILPGQKRKRTKSTEEQNNGKS